MISIFERALRSVYVFQTLAKARRAITVGTHFPMWVRECRGPRSLLSIGYRRVELPYNVEGHMYVGISSQLTRHVSVIGECRLYAIWSITYVYVATLTLSNQDNGSKEPARFRNEVHGVISQRNVRDVQIL